MEEREYITWQVYKTIMQSQVLLLEDMNARIQKDHADVSDPPLQECLRLSESERLIAELRHLITLPPANAESTKKQSHERESVPRSTAGQPVQFNPGSRITQKIFAGDIKVSPPQSDDTIVLPAGLGTIELTENDETTDVISRDHDQSENKDDTSNVIPLKSP